MNYPVFTNDSLTMMYESIRGALAADDAAEEQATNRDFAFVRRRIGKSTRPISRLRCSSAECFSTSIDWFEGRVSCRSNDAGVHECYIFRIIFSGRKPASGSDPKSSGVTTLVIALPLATVPDRRIGVMAAPPIPRSALVGNYRILRYVGHIASDGDPALAILACQRLRKRLSAPRPPAKAKYFWKTSRRGGPEPCGQGRPRFAAYVRGA